MPKLSSYKYENLQWCDLQLMWRRLKRISMFIVHLVNTRQINLFTLITKIIQPFWIINHNFTEDDAPMMFGGRQEICGASQSCYSQTFPSNASSMFYFIIQTNAP